MSSPAPPDKTFTIPVPAMSVSSPSLPERLSSHSFPSSRSLPRYSLDQDRARDHVPGFVRDAAKCDLQRATGDREGGRLACTDLIKGQPQVFDIVSKNALVHLMGPTRNRVVEHAVLRKLRGSNLLVGKIRVLQVVEVLSDIGLPAAIDLVLTRRQPRGLVDDRGRIFTCTNAEQGVVDGVIVGAPDLVGIDRRHPRQAFALPGAHRQRGGQQVAAVITVQIEVAEVVGRRRAIEIRENVRVQIAQLAIGRGVPQSVP